MTITGQWAQREPVPVAGAPPRQGPRVQALEDLRQKIHQFVVQELGPLLYDQRVSEGELRKQVEEQLQRAMAQERLALGQGERQVLIQSVLDDILGYGPIDRLLRDPGISEIMVNGPDHVYIERDGKITGTDVRFVDEIHLRRIIDKIVSQVGRRVDEATDLADDLVDDAPQVHLIHEPDVRAGDLPVAFDVHVVGAVDHDLADPRVAQQPVDGPVPEDVVQH